MKPLVPGPRALPHRTTLQRLNAELALTALELGAGRANHRPIHVALQVASACNLDCYMCLEHSRPPEMRHGRGMKSLPPALFEKLALEVLPYSSRVSFGIGGEPTLAENFEQFVARCFEFGQEIELITNATRFDHGDMAATIARCVSYLQISIDGATPATYERIRHGARLARVLANIRLLNEHRAAHERETRTHVSFWVTLMKSNVHELPLLVELAHELDIDRVHAHHVTPITPEGAADTLAGDAALWNEHREIAIARARELGVELDVPDPLPVEVAVAPVAVVTEPVIASTTGSPAPPIEAAVDTPPTSRDESRRHDLRYSKLAEYSVPCHLPATAIYVLWDGRVVPCCYPYAAEKMTLGNLAEQDFATIWNGLLYRHLRAGLKRGHVLSVCRHCPVVHDVPITLEEEARMRASPTLSEWIADGAPSVVDEGAPAVDVLGELRVGGALAELDDLRRHARNLEGERPHLLGHIANLEQERPHLVGHIANLERELERLRRARGNAS